MKLCQSFIDAQIRKTWNTPYVEITDEYIIRKFPTNVFEYDHSDGIGTRGIFHWQHRTFANAVIDSLAMNLNDLLMKRVIPFKLQNHIILPASDENAIQEIMATLTDECVKRQIAITGGETSIHEYFQNECLDISITMSGFCHQRSENKFIEGDVLIGLGSNGIHSNGFSFIRKASVPYSKEFTSPTRIYTLPNCLGIHGIQHITGGAFTKIKRLLSDCDAYIHKKHFLKPQGVFYNIYDIANSRLKGVDEKTMYCTFNCGIGMVLSVSPFDIDYILAFTGGEIIGEVRKGTGKVIIESMFDNVVIEL